MKYLKSAALIFMIASCHNNGNNPDSNDTLKDYSNDTNPAEAISTCYESVNGKDTVLLSLFSESEVITGSLIYNYYEKDKNKGTLHGNMHGDTLIANYIFMSEGKTSERQVAFLKQGNNFIEGYGDVEEQNGKMIFKNTSSLSFTSSPLHKVDCNSY